MTQGLAESVPEAASQDDSEEEVLHLVAHPDEGVNMGQVGHLQHWFGGSMRKALVHAPAVTSVPVLSRLVSSLFMFPNLSSLDLSIAQPSFVLRSSVLCAIAELSVLTHCSLTGGLLLPGAQGPKLEVLSSLRKLEQLRMCPCKPSGLCDDQVAGLAHLSAATLKSLTFRGACDSLSDEGLLHLTALRGLTELQVLPLGMSVTRDGMTKLVSLLPELKSLAVGLQQAGQVCTLRDCSNLRSVSIVANDSEAAPLDWSRLVTHATLCLSSALVTLRLGLLKMQDASFLLAMDTLANLTELKFAVSPATVATPSFTCDITKLSSLSRLHSLDIACTSRLHMPFTPRSVSVAALAWPQLTSLSLSVMGRQELVPEALALLDLFSSLRSLDLCCPLDYEEPGEGSGKHAGASSTASRTFVDDRYLPHALQTLVLEHADLRSGVQPALGSALGASLPKLSALQLDDCRIDDAAWQQLLSSTPALRRLELTCVDGLSVPGVYQGLEHLTCLQHLVLCSLTAEPTAIAKPNMQAPSQTARWSLEQLAVSLSASAPTLVQLEWSPCEHQPTTEAQLKLAAAGLARFNSLQFLYVESRAAANAWQSWKMELQHKLPLCTITNNVAASFLTYDIFSDTMLCSYV